MTIEEKLHLAIPKAKHRSTSSTQVEPIASEANLTDGAQSVKQLTPKNSNGDEKVVNRTKIPTVRNDNLLDDARAVDPIKTTPQLTLENLDVLQGNLRQRLVEGINQPKPPFQYPHICRCAYGICPHEIQSFCNPALISALPEQETPMERFLNDRV